MAEDDISQSTVRLPPETMERLRSELSHFSTDSARFQFLVQFYFDYKEMGFPQPVNHIKCGNCVADGKADKSGEKEEAPDD